MSFTLRSSPARTSRTSDRTRRRRGRPAFWAELSPLEERCLLTANGPYTFPSPTVDSVDKVLSTAVTGDLQKTITITNNSPDQYLYAFLEGEVSRQAIAPYQSTGAFDPYDFVNHEYRGYIGYTDGTDDYAGLPPKASITITVPLAFWDSGRIGFSTDGADQFSTYGGPDGGSPAGAPFNYLDDNTQAYYFGNGDDSQPNRLDFTPIDNGFDPATGKPTTTNWKSPIASGVFKGGQTLVVTGGGLPANTEATVDASNPNSLVLPADVKVSKDMQQYTFSALKGETISKTDRYIQPGFGLTTSEGTKTTDGLVMWYHALVSGVPNNDAPFQLTELSFRGTFYDPAVNVGSGFQYLLNPDDFAGAKLNSVDYDVSFVDTINLPTALEASDVAIPNTGDSAPFGWVGSSQALANFQGAIKAFTSTNAAGTNDNYLGTYFDGRGYPSYVEVDPESLKLPSGQNVFLASPTVQGGVADLSYYKKFSDGSTIKSALYALSSGGKGPSQLLIGGDPNHVSQGQDLGLSTNTMAYQYMLENLIIPSTADGHPYQVTDNAGLVGNVVGPYYASDNKTIIGVKLDRDVPADAAGQVSTFTLPQTDYAASRIAGLWYSWAKYYADHVMSMALPNAPGTIANGNVFTLSTPATGLVAGMAVTGAGVPQGTVVLSVSPDGATVRLSTAMSDGPATLSFVPPSFDSIVGYEGARGSNTPDIPLSFSAADQPYALAFARTIFTVMSAWSVSVPATTPNAWNPLMVNIIGGNLGANYLPNANTDVVNTLTVLSKSALRGVPDYTNPLYADPAQWYPDPAEPAGGQTYNVYDLDPFVWFIHSKLGQTAYAFSLDDDIGNVNAGGATHLDVGFGGLGGIVNRDPYTNVSPWGVVTSTASIPQQDSSVLVGLDTPRVVYQIAQFDYAHDTPGTLINGPGVPMGTTAQFTQISQDLASSRIVASNPLGSPAAGSPYSFFGALTFTGTVLGVGQAGDTIVLDGPDAYATLGKLGPLTNLRVTGEGIDPARTVTIQSLTQDTSGAAILQLSAALDPSLVSQPGSFYAYTVGSPVVGPIRDPGFEWADVQALAGGYNHGDQLSQNTVDWTFTDSPTDPKDWFAGIAFNDSPAYTHGNQLAPQGLQVGFVQGDSQITQTITVGGGTYTLTGMAALSAVLPTPQTLNVLIDGKQIVGTIAPTESLYSAFSIPMTLAAGKHTVTFAGTRLNSGTVLLDELALGTASPGTNPGVHPVLGALPNPTVNEGTTVSFTAVATGPTAPLTFSLDPGAPAGATIDPRTGLFTWTPTVPGTSTVTIRVADASDPSLNDSRTLVITVNNVAPVVSLTPNVVSAGAAFLGMGSYSDASAGLHLATVDYGDGTGPQPVALGSDGAFLLNHTYARPGTFTVSVSVRDAFGGLGTATVGLTASSAPLVSGFGAGRDAFVTALYQEALGRLPEPEGLKFWARLLHRGVDPTTVARSIWSSPEHRELVRSGHVAPTPFRRTLGAALRLQKRAVRLHLPAPAGP